MHEEIERKFLVRSDAFKLGARGVLFRQGYLSRDPDRVVRVRSEGEEATLAVKGLTVGASRIEFEYPIPIEDAPRLLAMCHPPVIEKTRWLVDVGQHRFEIDEFHGANAGLVVAEIELTREDEPFDRPDWLGEEVTGDARYYNSNLVVEPYSTWRERA